MTRSNPDHVSDDMLMALADGELDATDAQHLRMRIAQDPDLAARYADFAQTRALLQDAFAPDPVPDRLINAVLQGDAPQDKPSTIVPMRRRLRAATGWGLALAASLVLAIGGFWAGRSTGPMLADRGNIGMATATLPTGAEMLLPDGSTARVLASYNTDLGLCRMIAQDGLRHITCRDAQSGHWATALSVQAGDVKGTDTAGYLPAAQIGLALIDRLLDDIDAGPALTADNEQRALTP